MIFIENTFTNAILADATYVHGLTAELAGDELRDVLSKRMTPDLAAYIAKHFSVVTQIESGDYLLQGNEILPSGFDATVWRSNDANGNPEG